MTIEQSTERHLQRGARGHGQNDGKELPPLRRNVKSKNLESAQSFVSSKELTSELKTLSKMMAKWESDSSLRSIRSNNSNSRLDENETFQKVGKVYQNELRHYSSLPSELGGEIVGEDGEEDSSKGNVVADEAIWYTRTRLPSAESESGDQPHGYYSSASSNRSSLAMRAKKKGLDTGTNSANGNADKARLSRQLGKINSQSSMPLIRPAETRSSLLRKAGNFGRAGFARAMKKQSSSIADIDPNVYVVPDLVSKVPAADQSRDGTHTQKLAKKEMSLSKKKTGGRNKIGTPSKLAPWHNTTCKCHICSEKTRQARTVRNREELSIFGLEDDSGRQPTIDPDNMEGMGQSEISNHFSRYPTPSPWGDNRETEAFEDRKGSLDLKKPDHELTDEQEEPEPSDMTQGESDEPDEEAQTEIHEETTVDPSKPNTRQPTSKSIVSDQPSRASSRRSRGHQSIIAPGEEDKENLMPSQVSSMPATRPITSESSKTDTVTNQPQADTNVPVVSPTPIPNAHTLQTTTTTTRAWPPLARDPNAHKVTKPKNTLNHPPPATRPFSSEESDTSTRPASTILSGTHGLEDLDAQEVILSPRCPGCQSTFLTDDSIVSAVGQKWHYGCFKCDSAKCGTILGTKLFYQKGRNVYCEECWIRDFCTKCTACSLPIKDVSC
ncbi:Pre-rRNA-processing protein fhl1 [Blyttiomyces sp. JEL0837]|nr:Pre-rRNA-processing protein fhl1 [Blyttiomyces sp. JEL0837]